MSPPFCGPKGKVSVAKVRIPLPLSFVHTLSVFFIQSFISAGIPPHTFTRLSRSANPQHAVSRGHMVIWWGTYGRTQRRWLLRSGPLSQNYGYRAFSHVFRGVDGVLAHRIAANRHDIPVPPCMETTPPACHRIPRQIFPLRRPHRRIRRCLGASCKALSRFAHSRVGATLANVRTFGIFVQSMYHVHHEQLVVSCGQSHHRNARSCQLVLQ